MESSAFSGHLLGNREGLLIGTTEVRIDPLHQCCRRQQTGGCDHRSFPMDPMRFQGGEPGAVAGQGTTHNPEAVAVTVALPVRLSEPLPHGLAAVPRRSVPPPHQGGLASGRPLGPDPGQEGARDRTAGSIGSDAPPPVLVAHALGSPLLHPPAIAGQGLGVGLPPRHGLLDQA